MKFYADNIFKAYKNDSYIFIGIFIVTLVIILSVQIIILPYITPSWHAGNGLLKGGDWVVFHASAVQIAEKIGVEGWSAWELRPQGWFPAGVASAFYALFKPVPWVLAPLNAAVHATAVLLVMKIILLFSQSWKTAFFSALPFAFFPSAMLWYTQIHRDGYQILGIMFFLYGLLLVMSIKEQSFLDWKIIIKAFVMSGAGVAMIWLARPYTLVVMQYTTLILFLFVLVYLLILFAKEKSRWKIIIIQLLFLCLIILAINPLTKTDEAVKYRAEAVYIPEIQQTDSVYLGSKDNVLTWQKVSWIPKVVDDKLYSIALVRTVTYPERYGETASGIDYDRTFRNVYDFFTYLPRALQISFLAPFPNLWFGEGKYEATTFFRRVSALEMIFVYLSLPFLIYGIWSWRKKLELWVLVIFCTVMMLPIVYSVPNVGTIYRYRYGYLMLLVAVGVAAFIRWLQRSKIDEKTSDGKKYG